MTADKTQITLNLAPDVVEKIETIASKSGLTAIPLLEAIAQQLAEGNLQTALYVTSRFSLRDLDFKVGMERLIVKGKNSNDRLKAELIRLRMKCYP